MLIWISALITVTVTRQSIANGGAFHTSTVQRTGNLVPMEKRLISIESENLYIHFEGDDAHVSVEYMFVNNGPGDRVTFGFPIDVATPETLNTPNGYESVMSNSIRDFKIEQYPRVLPIEKVIDKPLAANERPRGIEPDVQLVRRWSTTTVKFEGNKRTRLVVSYTVRCAAYDKGFERDTLWKYDRRTFFYTFRPASGWGNGRASDLTITLNVQELDANEIPVTDLAPPGGKKQQGVITWHFHDVDLGKLPDLTCRFDPTNFYRDRDVKRNLIDREHIKSLSVSSMLPTEGPANYGKESMLDRDLRTAWVEGAKGLGVGEKITFEPKDVYVTEIGILNGYVTDGSRYYSNARIKKLRVDTEFKASARPEEPDAKPEQREISLPDRDYRNFNPRYPFSSVDWVVQHPDADGFIKKVVLTILEVYPGKQFEDTAVTELYICGFK